MLFIKRKFRIPSNALNRLFSKSQKDDFLQMLNFIGKKTQNRVLCHPLGDIGVNVYVSSMARWKVNGQLPISTD